MMAEGKHEPKQLPGQVPKQQARKTGGNGSHTIPIQMLWMGRLTPKDVGGCG